jgi:signal transduction histidine kinase
MSEPTLILSADDDPVSRDTLAALLAGQGYDMVFVDNGYDAIKQAHQIRPDVIFLDVMMPGLNGYETCRQLRQNPEIAEVPIFIITVLTDRESYLEGLQCGADEFLSKPYDSIELKLRLQLVARLKRFRKAREDRQRLSEALALNSEQNDKLRSLSKRLMEIQESERRMLAVELHDEIGQDLTGLRFILEQIRNRPADLDQVLDHAGSVLRDLLNKVQNISLNLRPVILDDFGLYAALDWLIKRISPVAGVIVERKFDIYCEDRYPREIETALFRVAQEALTNITKHAQADRVTVGVVNKNGNLKLIVEDNGKGFQTEGLESGQSTGLSGMRERIVLTGGRFSLESVVKVGTKITAEYYDVKKEISA